MGGKGRDIRAHYKNVEEEEEVEKKVSGGLRISSQHMNKS